MSNIPLFKLICPYILSILCLDHLHCPKYPLFIIPIIILISIVSIPITEGINSPLVRTVNLYLQMTLLGFSSYQLVLNKTTPPQVEFSENNQFFVLTVKEVTHKNGKSQVIAQGQYIGDEIEAMHRFSHKVKLNFDTLVQLEISDQILASARLNTFKPNRNPLAFNYQFYMARQGIHFQLYMKSGAWIKLGSIPASGITEYFEKTRIKIFNILESALPKKKNLAIISAMLLGIRSLIDDQTSLAFQKTGAVHILAVSGLHVGIISGIWIAILSLFKINASWFKILKLCMMLVLVWSFVLLSGAPASVIRAAIMFSAYYIGIAVNRTPSIYNIIAFAAFIMLLADPASLYDIGFQFSFLALLSIVYFFNKIEACIYFRNKFIRRIWQLIVISVAAQILVFPLALYYFHMFPNYFWLSGIFVVPLAGIILLLSIILIVLALCNCELLLSFNTLILNEVLSLFRLIIGTIESLPFSCFTNLYIDKISVLLIYLAIVFAICGFEFKKIRVVAASLMLYLSIIVYQIYHRNLMWSKEEIWIYDIYNQSLIDIFWNSELYQLSSQNLKASSIKFNSHNNRIAHYTNPLASIDLSHEDNLIFAVKAKNILFYPRTQLKFKKDVILDYLIVNKASFKLLPYYLKNVRIRKVILDSSIKHISEEIKELLNDRTENYFHTYTHGAISIQ